MAELGDKDSMPFGKFKGQRMGDVPAEYLVFLYDDGLSAGDVRDYIEDCMDALRAEVKKGGSL